MDPMLALIERLRNASVDIDERLEAAMMEVDVRNFSDLDPTPFFHDRPLVFLETPTGGVKTISAPHMIASLLLNLELETGQTVLLLGSKGGYMGAIIAELVGPEGEVIILDPSSEVVEYALERLHSYSNVRVLKLEDIAIAPTGIPGQLSRVLITGSLRQPPEWLTNSLEDGGFLIAPLGNSMHQTLIKRENQGGEMLDTDLGNVVFGPVDIAESEPSLPGPHELADMLEEAGLVIRDNFALEHLHISRLDNLVANLRQLPEDLKPPKITHPGEDDDKESRDHPLLKILEDEGEWLSGLWPLMAMLFDVRMTHPGAPDDDEPQVEEDTGRDFRGEFRGDFSGEHEDFIP